MRTMAGGEWEEVRAEGGAGTWWKGAMRGKRRRNCNNLSNKA